jgi:hypothetical protein
MDYNTIKEFLSSATFIYADITEEELSNATGSIYLTEVNGIKYLGTSMAIEELAEKELIAPAPVEEEVIVEEVPVVE